jgi:hypothetical protein
MYRTEEEARICQCPLKHDGAFKDICIGSECMAWRWQQGYVEPGSGLARNTPYKGYCGMAGRPGKAE